MEFKHEGVNKILELIMDEMSIPNVLEALIDESLNVSPLRLPPIFSSDLYKRAFHKMFKSDDFYKFDIIYGEHCVSRMMISEDLAFWSKLSLGWRDDLGFPSLDPDSGQNLYLLNGRYGLV